MLVLGACADADAGADVATTRTVYLDGGTVEVPVEPQRVVVLQSFLLPHVLSMGIEPIGVGLDDGAIDPDDVVPEWLEVELGDDVTVFAEEEPDLELIAALEPDLIVAFREEDGHAQLRDLAPLAVIDRDAREWRELTDGVAAVFEAEDRVAAFMDDYDERVEAFRDETLAELDARTVSVFRVRGPEELRIEVRDSFPGLQLAEAGVHRPATQDREGDGGFGYVEVGGERLADADADLMFAITYDRRPQTKQDLRDLHGSPVWHTLDGVQAGRVFEVDGATWFGGHPLAAIALLDDLAAAVEGELEPYAPG